MAVIFQADVEVPNEAGCGVDDVCKFLRKKAGLRKLALTGVVGRGRLILKFAIETDIVLKQNHIVLKKAELVVKLGNAPYCILRSRDR